MPVLQTLAKKLNKDGFQKRGTHACRETLGTRRRRSPGQKTSEQWLLQAPSSSLTNPNHRLQPPLWGRWQSRNGYECVRFASSLGRNGCSSITFVFRRRKIKSNRVKMAPSKAFPARPFRKLHVRVTDACWPISSTVLRIEKNGAHVGHLRGRQVNKRSSQASTSRATFHLLTLLTKAAQAAISTRWTLLARVAFSSPPPRCSTPSLWLCVPCQSPGLASGRL